MDQSQAQIEDIRLEGERRLKYKGTAASILTFSASAGNSCARNITSASKF